MLSDVCRTKQPKMPISIEYQDNDYTYISSKYAYKELKKDIETIKTAITIIWTK